MQMGLSVTCKIVSDLWSIMFGLEQSGGGMGFGAQHLYHLVLLLFSMFFRPFEFFLLGAAPSFSCVVVQYMVCQVRWRAEHGIARYFGPPG